MDEDCPVSLTSY